jgi:hypothetical protein
MLVVLVEEVIAVLVVEILVLVLAVKQAVLVLCEVTLLVLGKRGGVLE